MLLSLLLVVVVVAMGAVVGACGLRLVLFVVLLFIEAR